MSDPLLVPSDAARYLAISVKTLAKLRRAGDGPPFVSLGVQTFRYRASDLDKWLTDRVRESA